MYYCQRRKVALPRRPELRLQDHLACAKLYESSYKSKAFKFEGYMPDLNDSVLNPVSRSSRIKKTSKFSVTVTSPSRFDK